MKQGIYIIAALLLMVSTTLEAQEQKAPKTETQSDPCVEHDEKTYSWKLSPELGHMIKVPVDSSFIDFYNTDVEDSFSTSYNYLANFGLPGESRILFDREQMPEFIFLKAYDKFNVSPDKMRYYNTQIPYTKAAYLTGGSKANAEERLLLDFAGNVNRRWGVGANLDFIYTRGFYSFQAVNSLDWQAYVSYVGDKYQMHAYTNTANFSNQENGGISDYQYILEPESIAANLSDPKNIPTNLTSAWNRVRHKDYYFTQRYNLGFEREAYNSNGDSLGTKEFIPVMSFIHTFHYEHNFRRFIIEKNGVITNDYFQNNYLDENATNDSIKYWSVKNTIGLALNEGFHKYAKFGLGAYVTLENRRYTNMTDTLGINYLARKHNEDILWLGGELSKTKGSILTYAADAKFGMSGRQLGDIYLNGVIQTKIPLGKDSLIVRGSGMFRNTAPSYYFNHYFSNHFRWDNDFSKERRVRAVGQIEFPKTRTSMSVGVENITNYLYFNNDALAAQYGGNIQVITGKLEQNFKFGVLNSVNTIVVQHSSEDKYLPLPTVSIYSQLYLDFKIARVLRTQFGADLHYYSRYYSTVYQPATQMFVTQDQQKVGNYPLINVYANFRLKRAKFFAMFYHVNQGLFDNNDYFMAPGYPINPRFFKFGVSIDFLN